MLGAAKGKAELSDFTMGLPNAARLPRVLPSRAKEANSTQHRRARCSFLHVDNRAEESMGGSASNKMNNDAHESDMSCVLIRRAHVSA